MQSRRPFQRIFLLPIRPLIALLGVTLLAVVLTSKVRSDLDVRKNEVFLTPSDNQVGEKKNLHLRLAIISDLHIDDSESSYAQLQVLVEDVLKSAPQVILLLGDYTQSPRSIRNLAQHRIAVTELLGGFNSVPTISVLGNYENWSEPSRWSQAFTDAGINLLENEVLKLSVGDDEVCFRGLGDAFTKKFVYIDFPSDCSDLPKITFTHDPAGAFDPRIKGLIFAGHTHCGQVRIPYFGSVWVPSEAPNKATCGLYKDDQRLLWVTSGVGYSLLPIRFGAKAQWDLVQIKYSDH